ncbi:hypothetical protein AYO47_06620 [Planctomyces sp. SCGC AG-212-M04]|nr:hypothetical protein AYO47_06620 [Planctomyces sp. SCGC AG-212-M04]
MEQTTLSNPQLDNYINANFVPVHIDADRDQRVIQALHADSLPTAVVLGPNFENLGRISGYKDVSGYHALLAGAAGRLPAAAPVNSLVDFLGQTHLGGVLPANLRDSCRPGSPAQTQQNQQTERQRSSQRAHGTSWRTGINLRKLSGDAREIPGEDVTTWHPPKGQRVFNTPPASSVSNFSPFEPQKRLNPCAKST